MNRRSFLQAALSFLPSLMPTPEQRLLLSAERGDYDWDVYLNGVNQKGVISCKTGRRGWVKRYIEDPKNGLLLVTATERVRGCVHAVRQK